MMEVLGYITENALILIPALLIIGQIIKNIEAIPDKWIPVILLPIGIAGALLCGGLSVDSAIQGILVPAWPSTATSLSSSWGKRNNGKRESREYP